MSAAAVELLGCPVPTQWSAARTDGGPDGRRGDFVSARVVANATAARSDRADAVSGARLQRCADLRLVLQASRVDPSSGAATGEWVDISASDDTSKARGPGSSVVSADAAHSLVMCARVTTRCAPLWPAARLLWIAHLKPPDGPSTPSTTRGGCHTGLADVPHKVLTQHILPYLDRDHPSRRCGYTYSCLTHAGGGLPVLVEVPHDADEQPLEALRLGPREWITCRVRLAGRPATHRKFRVSVRGETRSRQVAPASLAPSTSGGVAGPGTLSAAGSAAGWDGADGDGCTKLSLHAAHSRVFELAPPRGKLRGMRRSQGAGDRGFGYGNGLGSGTAGAGTAHADADDSGAEPLLNSHGSWFASLVGLEVPVANATCPWCGAVAETHAFGPPKEPEASVVDDGEVPASERWRSIRFDVDVAGAEAKTDDRTTASADPASQTAHDDVSHAAEPEPSAPTAAAAAEAAATGAGMPPFRRDCDACRRGVPHGHEADRRPVWRT